MTCLLERPSPKELRAQKAQWRGSPEGLTWTPWMPMTSTIMSVPKRLLLKQVRVWIDGEWSYSPPGTTDCVEPNCDCHLRWRHLS
jgi:hypothetical protein